MVAGWAAISARRQSDLSLEDIFESRTPKPPRARKYRLIFRMCSKIKQMLKSPECSSNSELCGWRGDPGQIPGDACGFLIELAPKTNPRRLRLSGPWPHRAGGCAQRRASGRRRGGVGGGAEPHLLRRRARGVRYVHMRRPGPRRRECAADG